MYPSRLNLDVALGKDLAAINEAGLLRQMKTVESIQGPEVRLGGRQVLLLCSNNYLGLASHPRLIEAAREATTRWGTSSVSSRLISGHMHPHEQCERRLAAWTNTQSALLFSTGYQANLSVVTALGGPGDLVVSDQLNHASIIDGCRLARADVAVYDHCDSDHLESILAANRQRRRVLVITETVFSMDGDLAPLADISLACRRHGAWLMVDEAHASGIFGKRGSGLAEEAGIEADVHVGTLGKALGSFGAYVAGSRRLIDLLINRARPFIFTTGLPPAAAAAADTAAQLIEADPGPRDGLRRRARSLGQRLRKAGLNVPNTDSQIIPIITGSVRDTVAASERLLERGIYVAAIRPPTVPADTSRLRLSIMATHSEEHLERAYQEIVDCIA